MRERTFGPAVLAGLAGGGLAAISGSRDWVALEPGSPDEAMVQVFWESSPGLAQMPLAAALGLVVLACWGVLLVSRGRWRRVVAAGGLLAALGLLATWVVALVDLPEQVADRLGRAGVEHGELARTGWFWVALVAALLSTAACAAAVRWAPRWPAMGSRYDAPGAAGGTVSGTGQGQGPSDQTVGDQDPTDLWKALDEGRDPTRDPAP